jgi:hypothetical protein
MNLSRSSSLDALAKSARRRQRRILPIYELILSHDSQAKTTPHFASRP